MKNHKEEAAAGHDVILAQLKKRMKEKEITQKQLCEILGVGVNTITRWFKKHNPMPLPFYLEICEVLEMKAGLVTKENAAE